MFKKIINDPITVDNPAINDIKKAEKTCIILTIKYYDKININIKVE